MRSFENDGSNVRVWYENSLLTWSRQDLMEMFKYIRETNLLTKRDILNIKEIVNHDFDWFDMKSFFFVQNKEDFLEDEKDVRDFIDVKTLPWWVNF